MLIKIGNLLADYPGQGPSAAELFYQLIINQHFSELLTTACQSSCWNLKKPACSGDFRVGSRRFLPLPTVSEPFSTGSLSPDSCRMFSDNSGNFPVGLQPDLSGTYRNR